MATSRIFNKAYNSEEVGLIYRMIEGGDKDYDILVDNKPNVLRTNDPEKFYGYEQYIKPETYCITFRIFQGKSYGADSHVLSFPGVPVPAQAPVPVATPVPSIPFMAMEEPPKPAEGFKGFGGITSEEGLTGFINKELNAKKLEWDYAQLNKEHENLKTEFKAVLKENGDLEKQLESTVASNAKLGMLGTIAGPFFDNMLASSNKLKNTALGSLLTPIEQTGAPHQAHDYGEASFAPAAAPAVEPGMLEFCKYITDTFTPAEFSEIAGVVGAMGRDKSLINTVTGLLK